MLEFLLCVFDRVADENCVDFQLQYTEWKWKISATILDLWENISKMYKVDMETTKGKEDMRGQGTTKESHSLPGSRSDQEQISYHYGVKRT